MCLLIAPGPEVDLVASNTPTQRNITYIAFQMESRHVTLAATGAPQPNEHESEAKLAHAINVVVELWPFHHTFDLIHLGYSSCSCIPGLFPSKQTSLRCNHNCQ